MPILSPQNLDECEKFDELCTINEEWPPTPKMPSKVINF